MTTRAPERKTILTSADHRMGDVWWVDYAAADQSAAESFYADALGWSFADGPYGGGYRFAYAGDRVAAGLMEMRDETEFTPVWSTYINVASVADACARVVELGGAVQIQPLEVSRAGWMAFCVDPTGAAFGLWQPIEHTGAGLINAPGALCWSEVRSSDMSAATAFYSELFGWTPNEMQMGEMPYVQFLLDGEPVCGMCPWEGPGTDGVPSHWAITFGVDSIDRSIAAFEGVGGQVTWGPQKIPFGTVASVVDPFGAHLNILELAD